MRFSTSATLAAAGLVVASTSFLPAMATPALVARQATDGFYAPTANGGSLLTGNTYSGAGEPLNIIISSASDPSVLTKSGFEEYAGSFDFSPGDCLSISLGGAQTANLGDGNGALNQTNIMRYNFGQGDEGTCGQSFNGGNHFRYWIQNGSAANSGAIFIAASVEASAKENHMIVDNGYDLGRDWFVGNASVSNGTRSPGGFEYKTTVEDNTSLLAGIQSSQINHGIGVDGTVKVLTVKVTKTGTVGGGSGSGKGGSGSSSTSTPEQSAALPTVATSAVHAVVIGALALFLGVCLILV
ncbi:uncharacterized protein PFL1_00151 [Pseudozyma flocculosa PF-1]|uniref:Uncharacterized protein n=1 Tax=Pseudozyma flocculosa TaxID=84751 RepID=A0A5C3ETZ1_9BASI|nr:uncharacterized protein PFL1_00151 [Pseudozyma flocculosa PF-1]EPQ31952.1 hypothetical protein PFL1_00151 [Pseudozyma flocculosa PF-1]SPO35135.1 uncharacterized protein PSFLO_00606 [Pseudozyma flocculosa]